MGTGFDPFARSPPVNQPASQFPPPVSQIGVRAAPTDTVVRNSFILLSMVLAVAAGGAGIGLGSGLQWSIGMWVVFMLAFIGGPFLIRAVRGQAAIGVTFLWAGLIGFLLSPLIAAYLTLPGGASIVFNALATTAAIFVALAGYAVVSRRDFSFMGGFLVAGCIVVLVAIVANIFLKMPMLSVVISAVSVMLMSGLILYDVSRLIREGSQSAIDIVVSLFGSIVVMFSHLLNLFSLLSGSDD
jgi:modulator of FtsH protease